MIRKGDDGKFKTVKYADGYKPELEKLSKLLKEAAASIRPAFATAAALLSKAVK